MSALLKEISESEFKSFKIPILFEDERTSRVFGIVTDGKNEYKLGWQSDLIKPIIKQINEQTYCIGIDLAFSIFSFDPRKILQKFILSYFFYDVEIANEAIYLITELEVIKVSTVDFNMIKSYPLPSCFESIEFGGETVLIKCVDDELVAIE